MTSPLRLQMHIRRLLAAMAMAALPSLAATADADERARIAQERSTAEAQFSRRDRECRERFVVSSCIEEVRRERRQVLDALAARQLSLDETRRHDRSRPRLAELADRAAEDAKRDQERAAKAKTAASSPGAARPASAASDGVEAAPGARRPKHSFGFGEARRQSAALPDAHQRGIGAAAGRNASADAAARQVREARSRSLFAARQQQAAQHRDQATSATLKRMQQHPPARSLPVPTGPVGKAASNP